LTNVNETLNQNAGSLLLYNNSFINYNNNYLLYNYNLEPGQLLF